MNCDPHWTAYFSALLTPIVACFGIYIARRQWQTAQKKLKFDLFDRRFVVYEATRNFLDSVRSSGKVRDEDIVKFRVATREAKWLLNVEVASYLIKEIYEKSYDLQTLEMELAELEHTVDRATNVQKQRVLKHHLLAQYEVLDQQFSSFLDLQH